MFKKILLKPEDKEYEPPLNLPVKTHFQRMGILNPAVVQNGAKLDLYSRLIYRDPVGLNSCIVKNQGRIEDGEIRMEKGRNGFPLEKLVFKSGGPYGQRGVEDFKASYVQGEAPLHGFLVNYDGLNARTEYVRNNKLGSWEEFGVWFPNIALSKAMSFVGEQGGGRYKKRWEKEYSGNLGKYFLGTKDCAMFPLKVNGKKGIIIRILPDMQIVYVDDPIELARKEFWEETVKDLESKVLLEREQDWEKSHMGLAGPPFEIDEGVVIPYHGVVMKPERNYRFGLALVDKTSPQKVLARTKEPIIEATEPWEKNGVVSGKVVFPTGHAIYGGQVYWFYGAGDKYVAYYKMEEKNMRKSLGL